MHTALELETAHARQPVLLVATDNSGSGVLSLAGRKTSLTINSSKHLSGRDPQTGWFDLLVEESNGSKILLHNAIVRSSGGRNHERGEWAFEIFPNIVVLNADLVVAQAKVREIQFTADGLEDVFYYELTEWQSLYRAPSDVKKQIRNLRRLERDYPREYEYFAPSSIYLIHELPRVLRERIGDRTYEIFVGHSERHGRQQLTIAAIAIATIRFAKPVTLDEALDAIWAWRRFFQQIAMRPMPFLTLGCRGAAGRRQPRGDIYLSNMDAPQSSDDREMFAFGPRDVPFGQWKHRHKFAAVMRRWLELDEKRRLFRVRLDRVLERKRKEISTKLVADLCSAVEALTELRAPSLVSDADLTAIVDAAATAGAATSPPVRRDRLQGLLSMLQHQSLPQRLKLLAAAIESEIPKKDAQSVIKLARDMRTFEAHGDHWDEMTVPLVGPVLDLLASMCVLWDQTTCGMPASFDDRRLTASSRATWFAQELRARQTQA